MPQLTPESEFADLFRRGTPFIDVRAEVEFAKGTMPNAINLPILNTQERHEVGACYKQQGQESAVTLGHKLVSGDLKEQRIARWREFAANNPNTHIFCWRGGMRSNLTSDWLADAGCPVPLVQGGFKALRRFLMNETMLAAERPMLRIGGRTGCDKTGIITQLADSVDLEGHANHRGSSFGRRATPVPSQLDFEHALAVDLLKHRDAGHSTLVLEDESRCIGAVNIPLEFHQAMSASAMAMVHCSVAERVAVIRRVYIEELFQEFCATLSNSAEDPFVVFSQHMHDAMNRLSKRLGGARHQVMSKLLGEALASQQAGDSSLHDAWIEPLLVEYYDPLYDHQIKLHQPKIVFQGDWQEVIEWAQAEAAINR